MNQLFAIDLNLSPIAAGAIIISSLSFIIMFGIASAKGGFQELVNKTLENDKRNRDSIKERDK